MACEWARQFAADRASGITAGRGRDIFRDPIDEVRITARSVSFDGLGLFSIRAWLRCRRGIEATLAAAVANAGEVVAADVGRKVDIAIARVPTRSQSREESRSPPLRRSREPWDTSRLRATSEQATGRTSTGGVGIIAPPDHAVAAASYMAVAPLGAAIGYSAPVGGPRCSDSYRRKSWRPSAWLNPRWTNVPRHCPIARCLAPRFGNPDGASGLAAPVSSAFALARNAFSRAWRRSDAVHLRILGGVGQLIKVRPARSRLQADSHRVGFTGKRGRAAIAKAQSVEREN